MPTWLLAFLPKWNISQWITRLAVVIIILAMTIKLFRPDSKTVIARGGQAIYNQCEKEQPIMGCSIWKIKLKTIFQ